MNILGRKMKKQDRGIRRDTPSDRSNIKTQQSGQKPWLILNMAGP